MYDKYVIKEGDSLSSIASKFNTSVDKILDINNLYRADYLNIGDEIIVPKEQEEYFTYYTVNQGDNLYAIARKYNINPSLLAILNGLNMEDYIYPNQKILIPKSGYSFYVTKEGDTLDIIKDKFNKNTDEILRYNTTIYLLPGQLMINKNNQYSFFVMVADLWYTKDNRKGYIMIIRKPFKFLIKNFKIINFILLLLMGFCAYKMGKLVYFFKEFVQMGYSTVDVNLKYTYIGYLLPLVCLSILVISTIIFLLFRSKDKSDKVYLSLMVFYGALLIVIFVVRGILDVYEFDTVETSKALLYRDMSRFLFYPNFILMFFVFLNFIGFDLTSFSFTSLQDDIDIAESDDAEIEIGVKVEDYKIKRTIRRSIRELKYYVIENKLVFIFFAIIVGLVVLGFVINFLIGLNKTVKVSQSFNHQNFSLTVHDSILTTLDYRGNVIKDDKYYLAIVVNVKNISNKVKTLDTNNFWLDIGGEYLYPVLDKSSLFLDIGQPYFGGRIGVGEVHPYVIVYELTSNQLKNNYELKILDTIEYKDGIADPKYKALKVNPRRIFDVEMQEEKNKEDFLLLNGTNLLSISIKVNDYYLTKLYEYYYEFCYNDKCENKKNAISVGTNTKKVLMVLDAELNIDKKSNYMTFKKASNFYEDFVTIKYGYGDYSHTSLLKDVSVVNDKSGGVVLEVDADVMRAEWIDLVITVRSEQWIIKLK